MRWATAADDAAVATVARATGSAGECAGDDPRYLAHVRARGGLAVAVVDEEVVAYGGRSRTHGGVALTDLFVRSEHRAHGVGSLLLDTLWDEPGERLTFASSTPPAAAVYARRGLRMLWPLLYLEGDPRTVPDTALSVEAVTPQVAGGHDARWQQLHGAEADALVSDYVFWDGRANGSTFVVRDGDDLVAVGALGGVDASYGLAHLVAADADVAATAVLAAVRACSGPEQDRAACLVCVPGPSAAVESLLTAGFRIVDHDLHMATPGVRLDPLRMVLHPGLG